MKPGGKSFQKRMQEAQANSKDFAIFLEEVIEMTGPPVDTDSSPLPYPWNVHSAHYAHTGSCFKDSIERARGCWDLLDGICDWTPLRTLYKALRFSGSRGVSCMEIYSFCSQTSFAGKFPCLFTQSSTNLEWSAFSPVSPCPPCMGAMNQHDCIHCCCRNKPRGAIKVLLSDFIVKTHQACNFDPALDLRRLR